MRWRTKIEKYEVWCVYVGFYLYAYFLCVFVFVFEYLHVLSEGFPKMWLSRGGSLGFGKETDRKIQQIVFLWRRKTFCLWGKLLIHKTFFSQLEIVIVIKCKFTNVKVAESLGDGAVLQLKESLELSHKYFWTPFRRHL